MALDGMIGNGVKVGYSANSPVSWTEVGQILDAQIPKLMRDKVDRTIHSQSIFKRSLPGMAEVSDLVLKLIQDLDPATSPDQDEVRQLLLSGENVWWRIEIPTDRLQTEYAAIEFQGFVLGWEPSAPIEERQELTVTIAYDGDGFTVYPPAASAM